MAVYILLDQGNHSIKIGYTQSVTARLRSHSTSNPNLVLLALVAHGDRRCEQSIHRLLQGHRCPGTREWYVDSPTVRMVLSGVLERLDPKKIIL